MNLRRQKKRQLKKTDYAAYFNTASKKIAQLTIDEIIQIRKAYFASAQKTIIGWKELA